MSIDFANFAKAVSNHIMAVFLPPYYAKVRSSYGPLEYFSDIFISGKKCCHLSAEMTTFLPKMKISEKYSSGP